MSNPGLLLVVSLAHADPPVAAELRAAWEATRSSHWVHRPWFTERDWSRLAAGKVVRRRERLDGPDRVVAAIWSASPKDPLWLSVQDERHWVAIDGYVDDDLPGSTFAERTLYQRIGLPWPFSDRQWVIDLRNNKELLASSRGAVWERTWSLSSRRGSPHEDPSAVWVDYNDGGWILADIGTGTLLIYHVRATVDGSLPDEAATRWALMTVGGMLRQVDERATEVVPTHYVAGHAPVVRPDDTSIPYYGTQ